MAKKRRKPAAGAKRTTYVSREPNARGKHAVWTVEAKQRKEPDYDKLALAFIKMAQEMGIEQEQVDAPLPATDDPISGYSDPMLRAMEADAARED